MAQDFPANNLSTVNVALNAVLVKSERMPESATEVQGYDFNNGVDYKELLKSMGRTGFQATAYSQAVNEINRMIRWRLSDEEMTAEEKEDPELSDPLKRKEYKCKIFLGYTSNLISSGLRESIRYLVEHKMVDVVVTSAGGVEEDLIKCLGPTYLGSYSLPGKDLRMKGLNRIGNLLDWVTPLLDEMLAEQKEKNVIWTPSKIIWRLGERINNPSSFQEPGLIIDIGGDIRSINDTAVFAKKTGMIILGGGVIKHHIANANLMRNGADFAVYINTGQEFDGSDSGARPDEAVSWGKIRMTAEPVKVYADASFVFPLIVAETFAAQRALEPKHRLALLKKRRPLPQHDYKTHTKILSSAVIIIIITVIIQFKSIYPSVPSL
ncbi:DHS-like NAD/FAD-binding domain-containing protein [Chytridium lagenaria]|nr:DHS-like NAD/FAD-binding domain-containing protein [Chytridium lagenaria]